jgi:hypothetical protein
MERLTEAGEVGGCCCTPSDADDESRGNTGPFFTLQDRGGVFWACKEGDTILLSLVPRGVPDRDDGAATCATGRS